MRKFLTIACLTVACLFASGCLLERFLPQQEPESVDEAFQGLVDALQDAWDDILDDTGL